MGKTHLTTASSLSTAALLLAASVPALSWAVTTSTAPTTAAGVTLPSTFSGTSVANSGNLFTGRTCNAVQNAAFQGLESIVGMFAGRSASCARPNIPTTIALDVACPGSEHGPSADALSCQSLGGANGVPSEQVLCAKTQEVASALAHIQCQKSKASAVQAELECLTADAGRLTQQITSIQGVYQQNIQRMEQDMQKIEGLLNDRQAQIGEIGARLNGRQGEGGTGEPGLLALQAELVAATTGGGEGGGIDAQVTQIENQMTIAQQARRAFDEQVTNRTMELASECFNTRTSSNYRCDPNGPPVSAMEYALCRYEQTQRQDSRGNYNTSQQSAARAQSNRAGLESVLRQIFDDAPRTAPQTADTATAGGTGPRAALITSAADVDRLYGDQLAQYNGKLNIQAFVSKAIHSCFDRSTRIVETEKTRASSPLSQTRTQMETAQNDLRARANTMIEAGAQLLTRSREALTGKNLPVSTTGCKDAEASVQVSCLKNLKRDMATMLNGDRRESVIAMEFRGSDPNNRIAINCWGINGCIADLRNTDRNLRTEVQRVGAFKQSYVTQARQSTDAFTSQMATMMSTQSKALKDRLQRLNSVLTTQLHAREGINIADVEPEQMQYGENGLPQTPQNVLGLISGKMNPHMLNVSGDNFSGSLSSVQEALAAYDQPLNDLNAAKNKLAGLQTSCRQERLAALVSVSDPLANCGTDTQFCEASGQSRVQELMSSLASLGLTGDSVASIESNLNAGIEGCSASSTRRSNRNQQLAELENELNATTDQGARAELRGQINALRNGTSTTTPSNCFAITQRIQRGLTAIGGSSSGSSSSGAASGDE